MVIWNRLTDGEPCFCCPQYRHLCVRLFLGLKLIVLLNLDWFPCAPFFFISLGSRWLDALFCFVYIYLSKQPPRSLLRPAGLQLHQYTCWLELNSGCFLSMGETTKIVKHDSPHVLRKEGGGCCCCHVLHHKATPFVGFFITCRQSQELSHRGVDAKGMLLCQVFVDIRSLSAWVTVAHCVFTGIWLFSDSWVRLHSDLG